MVMIMKATDQRIRAEILARYDVDARRCREVFFPAGQQLHAQDAPLENIFLVISGSIFISKSSSNGLSGASCYECTHGCIGAMEIFLDTMRFDCSSVASTDVTTFLLPIDYVQELLQSSFTFVRQIASDLAEQLQHTHVILNDAQTHAAVERLARYLMVVSEQQLYRSGIQQAAVSGAAAGRHAGKGGPRLPDRKYAPAFAAGQPDRLRQKLPQRATPGPPFPFGKEGPGVLTV